MHEFSARVELDDDAAARIAAVVERYHRGDLKGFLLGAFLRGLMDSLADGEDVARADDARPASCRRALEAS